MSKTIRELIYDVLGATSLADRRAQHKRIYNNETEFKFSSPLSSYYSDVAKSLGAKEASVCFSDEHQAYSYSYFGSNYIVIGSDFYLAVRGIDPELPVVNYDYRKYTKDILKVIDGVYWHEVFHLLYTDMSFGQRVMQKLKDLNLDALFEYFKSLFNIIEDQYIEIEGAFQHPYSYDSIRYLNYVATQTHHRNNPSDHQFDPDKFDDLIRYLYFKLRAPSIVMQEHPVYTQNKDFIDQAITLVLQTFIPSLRVERTLALTIELMKLFASEAQPNLDNINFAGDTDEQIEQVKDMQESKNFMPSDLKVDLLNEINISKPAVNNSRSVQTGDQFLDRTQTMEQAHSLSKQTEKPGSMQQQVEPTSDMYIDQLVRKMAADNPDARYKSHMRDSSQILTKFGESKLPYYRTVATRLLQKYSKEISQTAHAFDEIKELARLKPRTDLYTGEKLNLRSLYNPAMIGKYQSDIAEIEVNNLSVSLMVDMSGSMANLKSEYARDAAFMIAKALEYSGVPFELSFFTTRDNNGSHNDSYVGIVKSFDEPVTNETASIIAMMNLRDMRSEGKLYFDGVGNANVDEIAIMHIAQRFQQRPEQTKLLIVLSDGATVGSETTLKQVVQSLPDYGIQTFAVGLYSSVVSKIYPHHLLVDEEQQLKLLPKTLMDVVIHNVTKSV